MQPTDLKARFALVQAIERQGDPDGEEDARQQVETMLEQQPNNLAVLLERLRSMPQSLRDPWLLRYIDGETLPRIAELCDCSQSTVQRRLREASEVMLGHPRPDDAPASVVD